MNVFKRYGGLWDIKLNPTKSQLASFGFGNNSFCDIYLNGSAVVLVDSQISWCLF